MDLRLGGPDQAQNFLSSLGNLEHDRLRLSQLLRIPPFPMPNFVLFVEVRVAFRRAIEVLSHLVNSAQVVSELPLSCDLRFPD